MSDFSDKYSKCLKSGISINSREKIDPAFNHFEYLSESRS